MWEPPASPGAPATPAAAAAATAAAAAAAMEEAPWQAHMQQERQQ